MRQRRFLIRGAQVLSMAAAMTLLSACAIDDILSPKVGDLGLTFLNVTSTVVAGHSHGVVISTDDLASTVDRTYTSSVGAADNHTHRVTLTSAHFATLRSGGSVIVTSTTDAGHAHDFTFRR